MAHDVKRKFHHLFLYICNICRFEAEVVSCDESTGEVIIKYILDGSSARVLLICCHLHWGSKAASGWDQVRIWPDERIQRLRKRRIVSLPSRIQAAAVTSSERRNLLSHFLEHPPTPESSSQDISGSTTTIQQGLSYETSEHPDSSRSSEATEMEQSSSSSSDEDGALKKGQQERPVKPGEESVF
jgi:hypothetical protein